MFDIEKLRKYIPEFGDRESITLKEITADPISSFIFLERNINRGSYHKYAHYSEVTQPYRPFDGQSDFQLPFVSLPLSRVSTTEIGVDPRIREWVLSKDFIKFFIHPDMLGDHRTNSRVLIPEDDNNFTDNVVVAPTSSTRTVVVINSGTVPFMLKVDLRKVISRFTRELDAERVDFSLEVSRELGRISEDSNIGKNWGFLPETLGSSVEFPDGHSIGFLVREFVPRSLDAREAAVLPFFSLFSKNRKQPKDELLIFQIIQAIIENKKASNVEEALTEFILRPLIESWSNLVFGHGILPERHAQNGLISVDSNGVPIRVIDRDLQGFEIDIERRRQLGLTLNFSRHLLPPERRKVVLSRSYDHRIGFQVIDPILDALEERFGPELRLQVTRAIKEIFYSCVPSKEHNSLPEKQFGLDNTTMFGDNPTVDIAKEDPPKYR